MWPKLPTPTISPGGAGGRASCAATEPKKSAAIDADTSAVTNLDMAALGCVVVRRSAPTRNTTPARLGGSQVARNVDTLAAVTGRIGILNGPSSQQRRVIAIV